MTDAVESDMCLYDGLADRNSNVLTRPLVSVCIQTYNHGSFIAQALDSVLMQETDFDYEIILGEDESEDGTREICMEYAGRYPDRIRLFVRSRQDVLYIDGRPTGRFNFVENLKAARGRYMAICDGDDYWTDPHKLQKQVDFLEGHPDYVLCHHDAMVVDQSGNLIQDSFLPPESKRDLTADELVLGTCVLPLTVCFRNVLDKYPAEFFRVVNGDTFLFSLLGNFGVAKYLGDAIRPAAYRVHPGGAWTSISDDWKRAVYLHTTYYWLRKYYSRLGCEQYALSFARKLYPAVCLYQGLEAEQVDRNLTDHLHRLEEFSGVGNPSTEDIRVMRECLSAHLLAGAAFASFAQRRWEIGWTYLGSAMEFDPEAWADEILLEKLLLDHGAAAATAGAGFDATAGHDLVEGIGAQLVRRWPQFHRLFRRVRGRLFAEAAYRCYLANQTKGARYFTWRALRANPLLVKDIGMLRRALRGQPHPGVGSLW